jgi:hypothetical protein
MSLPPEPDSGPALRTRHLVIAGMPRAGTTYLYHALAVHPSAFVPYRKELRFFSAHYHRGPGWYERFFAGASPDLLRVDASPDYFMDPAAAGRIAAYSPSIRVVIAVRDPAEWAVSLHRHLGTLEWGVPEFNDFLHAAEYPDFGLSRSGPNRPPAFSLQGGFVQRQLAAYREALGARLLLFDFAWFERDPLSVLRALESFLGLDTHFAPSNLPAGRINARTRETRRWFNYLASRDILVNAAGAVLPRKLVLALRLKADRASVARQRTAPSPEDGADLAAARLALAPDTAAVAALFARGPVVLGDGRVLG